MGGVSKLDSMKDHDTLTRRFVLYATTVDFRREDWIEEMMRYREKSTMTRATQTFLYKRPIQSITARQTSPAFHMQCTSPSAGLAMRGKGPSPAKPTRDREMP